MNYLHDIYILATIKRYSTTWTIREESVAEHGFMVAAIVMELHDHYTFNLGDALKMAVAHDMPEMELNDASHLLKKNYPEIKEAFDVCEKRVARLLPKQVTEAVLGYDSKVTVASKVVHLADAIQCKQFSQTEVKMGNKGYMLEVLKNSEERITKLKQELQKYERNN